MSRQIAGLQSLAHVSGQPRASLSPMRESQRDVGLIRVVGPWALAAGAISMIVGGYFRQMSLQH
jgi:hypothetical protein